MLTNKEIQIYGPLQKLKILYEGFPHPPIVTLDEGLALAETIKAVAVKDLFGEAPKKKLFFLFLLAEGEFFTGKALQETLGAGHLTFGDKKIKRPFPVSFAVKRGCIGLGTAFDTKQAVTLAHFPYPLIEKGPNLPSLP